MRPRLMTAWVHTFWDVFDHLGFWFLVNLVCLLSVGSGLLFPVVFLAGLESHRRLSEGREVSLKEFFKSCLASAFPGILLGFLHLLVVALACVNLYFYWTYFGSLGKGLFVVTLLFLFFWKTLLFFVFPLVLLKHPLRRAFRLSFSLAVKHFSFVLLFFTLIVFVFFACAVSVVGVLLLYFSILIVFWGNAFDQIRRCEEKAPPRLLPEKTFRDLFFPFRP